MQIVKDRVINISLKIYTYNFILDFLYLKKKEKKTDFPNDFFVNFDLAG